jgi:hypothetical protein
LRVVVAVSGKLLGVLEDNRDIYENSSRELIAAIEMGAGTGLFTDDQRARYLQRQPSTNNNEPPYRRVTMVRVADIRDAEPEWAWQCNGHGLIQRGTLGMFAGCPSAGKSTAAKFFAATFSQGTLDGCWAGHPQKVAYISTDESDRCVVKPGLRDVLAAITGNSAFGEVPR